LPNEIASWLTALLLKMPVKEQLQGKTFEDQDRAWRRWEEYANSIGIGDDLFLDGLSKPNRIKIMGAFAMALREGKIFEASSCSPG